MVPARPACAPTAEQTVLGRRLRRLRERADVSLAAVAAALQVAPQTVVEWEEVGPDLKPEQVERLLHAYAVSPADTAPLLSLIDEVGRPRWWQRYHDVLPDWFGRHISLEAMASVIGAYEPHCVPGLLQTEDYARAVLTAGFPNASADELRRRVELRRERQAILHHASAPQLRVVLDEAALRRRVGGTAVMREQIDRLVEASALPNVSLRVLPFDSGAHPGMFGPFHLFEFTVVELPETVCQENLDGACYLDVPAQVAIFRQVLDRVRGQAATEQHSTDLLRELRAGL